MKGFFRNLPPALADDFWSKVDHDMAQVYRDLSKVPTFQRFRDEVAVENKNSNPILPLRLARMGEYRETLNSMAHALIDGELSLSDIDDLAKIVEACRIGVMSCVRVLEATNDSVSIEGVQKTALKMHQSMSAIAKVMDEREIKHAQNMVIRYSQNAQAVAADAPTISAQMASTYSARRESLNKVGQRVMESVR